MSGLWKLATVERRSGVLTPGDTLPQLFLNAVAARGDAVIVRDSDGHGVGRGLVAYDAEDAERIKGRSSQEAATILGGSGRAEIIHRDDLVVEWRTAF